MLVILREAGDMFVQRNDSGGSDHADLAHSSARHFTPAHRFLDQLATAAQN